MVISNVPTHMSFFWSFLLLLRRPTIDPIYLANTKKRRKKAARRSVTTHRRKMRAHLSQSEELILFCRGRLEKVCQKIVEKEKKWRKRVRERWDAFHAQDAVQSWMYHHLRPAVQKFMARRFLSSFHEFPWTMRCRKALRSQKIAQASPNFSFFLRLHWNMIFSSFSHSLYPACPSPSSPQIS